MDQFTPPPLPVHAVVNALRDRTDRQLQAFGEELAKTRGELLAQSALLSIDVQAAFQHLQSELTGEKRFSLAVLNALIDQVLDLERLAAAVNVEAVAVAARAAQDALAPFGVHRYRPAVGDPYDPAWHERVMGRPADAPDRVVEVVEAGYVCEKPDLILRRARVVIGEPR